MTFLDKLQMTFLKVVYVCIGGCFSLANFGFVCFLRTFTLANN